MYRAIFMLVGAAIGGLILVLFSLNGHPVAVEFPMLGVRSPLNTVLALCFVAGVACGFFFAGWSALSCRRRLKELRDKAAVAEQEVFHLRRNVIQE